MEGRQDGHVRQEQVEHSKKPIIKAVKPKAPGSSSGKVAALLLACVSTACPADSAFRVSRPPLCLKDKRLSLQTNAVSYKDLLERLPPASDLDPELLQKSYLR